MYQFNTGCTFNSQIWDDSVFYGIVAVLFRGAEIEPPLCYTMTPKTCKEDTCYTMMKKICKNYTCFTDTKNEKTMTYLM